MIKKNKGKLAIDHKSLVIKGYTLIEILVSLTIIGLLFTFGYVSFREYSRRQAFAGVVRSLKADLRLAQERALAGNKPDDIRCTAGLLSGYNVRIASSTYAIEAVCTGGTVAVKSVDIEGSGVSMAIPSLNPIFFKILGQGTNITSDVVITLTQGATGSTQTVTITRGGEIK